MPGPTAAGRNRLPSDGLDILVPQQVRHATQATVDQGFAEGRWSPFTLHRATALVDRVADTHLRPTHDVTFSMFAALVTIDAIGPARQSKIARALDVSRAAVTQRLVELVARGLVEVAPDAADQRANRVDVTRKGRELLDAAWKGLAESDDGIENGVDLDGLQSALDTLIANAARYLAAREETA